MFSKNSIGTRLFNGYFIIIIFLGIVTIVSLVKLGSINYLRRSFIESDMLRESLTRLEICREKLIIKSGFQEGKGYQQDARKDCLNILNSMREESSKLLVLCENKPLLLQQCKTVKRYSDILYSGFRSQRNSIEKRALSVINNFGVILNALRDENYKKINTLHNSFGEVIRSAFLTIIAVFLITVVCGIFLSINIASSITNPLRKLMTAARDVGEGKLFVRVNTDTYDEISTLASSFNKMITTLEIDQKKIKEYNKNLELKNTELKSLSHKLFSVQEDERKRLSQVLHEEIGQSLSALKINMKLLEHHYNDNKGSKALSERGTEFHACLEDCRKILDTAFGSLKSLTFNLKYNILDKLGILAATDNFIEQISERVPIRIVSMIDVKEECVPEKVKLYLFRILCEAVTNIIKHANATLIRLEFGSEKNNIYLRITDNGRGFNVEDVLRKGVDELKMGITTIKELTNIMNGDLQIISKISKGTSLVIKVPYYQEE